MRRGAGGSFNALTLLVFAWTELPSVVTSACQNETQRAATLRQPFNFLPLSATSA